MCTSQKPWEGSASVASGQTMIQGAPPVELLTMRSPPQTCLPSFLAYWQEKRFITHISSGLVAWGSYLSAQQDPEESYPVTWLACQSDLAKKSSSGKHPMSTLDSETCSYGKNPRTKYYKYRALLERFRNQQVTQIKIPQLYNTWEQGQSAILALLPGS